MTMLYFAPLFPLLKIAMGVNLMSELEMHGYVLKMNANFHSNIPVFKQAIVLQLLSSGWLAALEIGFIMFQNSMYILQPNFPKVHFGVSTFSRVTR